MGSGILAHHAHIFPASVNPDGTVDQLLRMLDDCGIEEAVCFAPFPYQLAGTGLDQNKWLVEQIRVHNRLHGFGTLNLSGDDLKQQVRQIVELGLRGIKLHPHAQEFDIVSPRAFEVYAIAQELDLFLTFHTGVHHSSLKETSVLKFDEVARTFPDLRFSLEHMGGYHFFNEALAVLLNNFPPPWIKGKTCKVFAGLSSIFTQHQNRFWYLRKDQILEIILQTSIDQVIFGLDFPYNRQRETNIALQTIDELGLSPADKAKLLGGNLRRELKRA